MKQRMFTSAILVTLVTLFCVPLAFGGPFDSYLAALPQCASEGKPAIYPDIYHARFAPISGRIGMPLKVNLLIGEADTGVPNPFSLGIYLSKDPTFDSSDTLLGLFPISLGISELNEYDTKFKIPRTIKPGQYYVIAVIDPQGVSGDCYTADNVVVAPNMTVVRKGVNSCLKLTGKARQKCEKAAGH